MARLLLRQWVWEDWSWYFFFKNVQKTSLRFVYDVWQAKDVLGNSNAAQKLGQFVGKVVAVQ